LRRLLKGQFENGHHLVYTVIIGEYDRLKRPLWRPKNVDYVAFVSNFPHSHFRGWKIVTILDEESSPTLANRRMKILGVDLAEQFESVVYVDGSIQIVGSLRGVISRFLGSGRAFAVFRHRDRSTPWEELTACQKMGHFSVEEFQFEKDRLRPYRKEGIGLELFDAGVLIRNPRHEELAAAMSRWFLLFEQNPIRDQLSLPIVVWENRSIVHRFGHWADGLSPTFLRHPHRGDGWAVKLLFWLGALGPHVFQILLKLKHHLFAGGRP